jgi:hypothetical protein
MTISRWSLLRMRNVLDKVVEKIVTHILWDNLEIWSNQRPVMTIWRMRVAVCIIKATRAQAHACASARTHPHTHAHKYAFPRQQWFRECAPVLRYTYIACLVMNVVLLRASCLQPFIYTTTSFNPPRRFNDNTLGDISTKWHVIWIRKSHM